MAERYLWEIHYQTSLAYLMIDKEHLDNMLSLILIPCKLSFWGMILNWNITVCMVLKKEEIVYLEESKNPNKYKGKFKVHDKFH